MKFAIIALLSTAAAIRFSDNSDLSADEEANLIRPTLVANQALPERYNYQRSFSQALEDEQSGTVHWDTEFRNDSQELKTNAIAPVIQPSQDMLSRGEQMELVREANEELEIRHTAVLPDAAIPQQAPAKSPKQIEYDAAMHNKMFPRFHDDKEMGDSRISSDMLRVVGV